MSLTIEKIAEIQTILDLLGRRVHADDITTTYDENVLALTDPEAFEKLWKSRSITTGRRGLINDNEL